MRVFFLLLEQHWVLRRCLFFLKGRGTTKPDTGYKVAGTAYTYSQETAVRMCVLCFFFNHTQWNIHTLQYRILDFARVCKSANKQKVSNYISGMTLPKSFFFLIHSCYEVKSRSSFLLRGLFSDLRFIMRINRLFSQNLCNLEISVVLILQSAHTIKKKKKVRLFVL